MASKNESEKIRSEQQIKREFRRLKNLFKDLDENKRKIVEPLIKEAAFMVVTLEELRTEISGAGVSETYQNGSNQTGIKETTEVKVYNTMIKNYTSIVKMLTDLAPPAVRHNSKLAALRKTG